MICAFQLPRRPKSANGPPKASYALAIAQAARRAYSGPLVDQALYSRIIWFHKDAKAEGDADNIAKRIHDALKDVLFADDRLITHTLSVRVDASAPVELVPAEDELAAVEIAINLADNAVQDILYIELGYQTDQRIYLGPVL